jgi:hypothetical protein
VGRIAAPALLGWLSCTFPDVTILGDGATGTTSGGGQSAGSTAASGATSGSSNSSGGGSAGSAGVGGCRDGDGDGQQAEPCGADCNDDNDDVFFGQPDFFPAPIPVSGGFDYDCSREEERDPSQLIDCASCLLGQSNFLETAPCGLSNGYRVCPVANQCMPDSTTETLRCH